MNDATKQIEDERTKTGHGARRFAADTADLVGEAARRLPEAARVVDRLHAAWVELVSPTTPKWKKALLLLELARIVVFGRGVKKKDAPPADQATTCT